MGLVVLLSRLKAQMEHLSECLIKNEVVGQYEELKKNMKIWLMKYNK